MLKKLKHSRFGIFLYRLSRSPYGAPLRWVAKGVQAVARDVTHLSRGNRSHNTTQRDILRAFENANGGGDASQ